MNVYGFTGLLCCKYHYFQAKHILNFHWFCKSSSCCIASSPSFIITIYILVFCLTFTFFDPFVQQYSKILEIPFAFASKMIIKIWLERSKTLYGCIKR